MAEAQGDQTSEAQDDQEEGFDEEVALTGDLVIDTVMVIARALVEHVDDVQVTDITGDRGPRYRLDVHPDDMGRVIGRGGHMARAVRQLARAAASRDGIHIVLDIGD